MVCELGCDNCKCDDDCHCGCPENCERACEGGYCQCAGDPCIKGCDGCGCGHECEDCGCPDDCNGCEGDNCACR